MYSFVQKVTYQGEKHLNMPNQTEGSSSMYTSTYQDCSQLFSASLIVDSTFSNVPLPYSSNLQVTDSSSLYPVVLFQYPWYFRQSIRTKEVACFVLSG